MVQALVLADWLEELAVYGTARRPQSAETACQLSLVIKNWYLVKLALNNPPPIRNGTTFSSTAINPSSCYQ